MVQLKVASKLFDRCIRDPGWILSHKDVLASYESVFSSVRSEYTPAKGAPLVFVPPRLDGYTFTYRGLQYGENVLMLEIQEIYGLRVPVDRIKCYHPNFKRREYLVNGDKKKVFTVTGADNEFELLDEPPREDIHQPLLSQDQTTAVGIVDQVEVIRVPQGVQEINQGPQYVYKKGSGGAQIPASVDESVPGGRVQPVDLQVHEVTKEDPRLDFEEFLEMKNISLLITGSQASKVLWKIRLKLRPLSALVQ